MQTFIPSLLAAPLWASAAPGLMALSALALVFRVRWSRRAKALASIAILGATVGTYYYQVPLRVAFAISQPSFAAALEEARAAPWFTDQEPWQIGLFRIDRWSTGTHSTVFFETREWSLGLFDASSYGIVYSPKRDGRPYWGQGMMRAENLEGAWYWYATNQ